MNKSSLVFNALSFACNAHAGTCRKGTDIPYVLHPVESAIIVATVTDDPELIAAALLHDTVEDTDTSTETLRQLFGERVAALVADETENKRENVCSHDSWCLRKEEAIAHLRSASIDAKIVALGDKLSNMRAISRDYAAIGDKLWERFNVSDPAQQGWYYRALTDVLSDLSETSAWQELRTLVDGIFPVG